MLKGLLRAYSYIFEGLLALFLLALSLFALATGSALNLTFLPWTGQRLDFWLLAIALSGLLFLIMALYGWFRGFFFLWTLAVLVLLVRGIFLTSYSFSGPLALKPALWLILAALFGAIGAWPSSPRPRRIRRAVY